MPITSAVRLVSHLNALAHGTISIEVAAHTIASDGLVHHVIDSDGVLGLDPLHATALSDGLAAACLFNAGAQVGGWQLVLPAPGRLGALRGPAGLSSAAIEAGAVVVPMSGGAAWVPQLVGGGVQWRILRADPPAAPPTRYDAERRLSETVLAAAGELGALGTTGGRRPPSSDVPLAAGYSGRSIQAATRALLLLTASRAGLDGEHELLSSHAVQARGRTLRDLEAAAGDALCAACVWPQ